MARGAVRVESELRTDSRRLDPELRRAEKKYERFGKNVAKRMKSSFGGIGRSLMGLTGIGAGFGFAAIGQQVLGFEKKLTRLGIQARRSPRDMASLRTQIHALSQETGESADAILDATARYVSLTGDIDGAEQAMRTFAMTSVASGTAMGDVAGVAASLQKTMDISPDQFEKAMSIMLAAGKAGSVELKDLAALLGTIAPQFQTFGESGEKGLNRLAAAFQVVTPAFGGSAKEATTGLRALMTSFARNAKRIKALSGVDVYKAGTTELKSQREIVEAIGNSKLGKNPTLLIEALGSTEAQRSQDALFANLQLWDQIYEASRDAKDVAEDYATFQQSAAGRQQKSWNRVKLTIAELFTPERIEKFTAAMERVGKAVAWMADNLQIVLPLLAGAKLSGALMSLIDFSGGPDAKKMGAAGQLFGAAAAAALGYGIGSILEKKFNLSDKLLGIEDTTRRKTTYDPTGKASAKMIQAAQLRRAAARERARIESAGELGGATERFLTRQSGIDIGATESRAAQLEREAGGIIRRGKREQLDVATRGRITIDEYGLIRLQEQEVTAERRTSQ